MTSDHSPAIVILLVSTNWYKLCRKVNNTEKCGVDTDRKAAAGRRDVNGGAHCNEQRTPCITATTPAFLHQL